jgi:hypothetical protein
MALFPWLHKLSLRVFRPRAARPRPRLAARPCLEPLESRVTPAWVGSLHGTALTFTGTSDNAVLTLGVNAQGLITHNRFGVDPGYASNTDLDPNTAGVQSLSLSALTSLSAGGNAFNLNVDLTALSYNGPASFAVTNLFVKAAGDASLTNGNLSLSGGGSYALSNVQEVVLLGGPGNHTFTVGNRTGGAVLKGGSGNNTYVVALQGAGQSNIQIDDSPSAGSNTLVINAPAGAAPVTVGAGVVTCGGEKVTFDSGIKQLFLNTPSGGDVVAVQALAPSMGLLINAGAGKDTIIVGTASGTLNGISGAIAVQGGAGGDTLELNASGTTAGGAYAFNGSVLAAPGLTIYYGASGGGFGSVVLLTGAGADTVTGYGTAAGTFVSIGTGGGNDSIQLIDSGPFYTGYKGGLWLDAGPGANSVTVNESGAAVGDLFVVTANSIYSPGQPFALHYQATSGSFSAVDLLLGSGDDTVYVEGTAAGALTAINGGGGHNSLVVSSTAGTLDGFAGGIYYDGGSGENGVIAAEPNDAQPDTLVASAGVLYSATHPFSLVYLASGGGTFGDGVQLVGGSGGDYVAVQGVAAGSWMGVTTGVGDDTVIVSSPTGTLAGFNGSLFLDEGAGNNALIVSAAGSVGAETLGLSADVIFDTDQSFALNYKATGGTFLRGVLLAGGSGADSFILSGKRPDAPTTVQTGSGSNTVLADVDDAGDLNGLVLDGQAGTNTLLVHDLSGGLNLQVVPGGGPSGLTAVDSFFPNGALTYFFEIGFGTVSRG